VNADQPDQKPAANLDPFPPAVPPQAEVVAPRSGASNGLLWVAVLLAAVALLVAGWMGWQGRGAANAQAALWRAQQQQQQDELKRLETELAAVRSASSQQSSELDSDLQQRLQALEADTNADADFRSESAAWTRSAQAALEDSQARLNQVDERLQTLSARSAEADAELELEEIDYLLRMAQERLQLFGDVRNADRALQLADQQVVAFDNPMFIALRREIAAARQALAATDAVDLVTLGAELDRIQDSVALLPFRSAANAGDPLEATTNATGAELPWWQKLKNVLAGLVTVRRVADDELALPALADQQALRQRAWLQAEQARLAALSREHKLYLASLQQAEATIQRWFAADDENVKQTLASLHNLQQRNVDPPMPDISAPWTTLRTLRDAGLSASTSTAAEVAAPVEAAAPPAQEAETEAEPVPAEEASEQSPSTDDAEAGSDAGADPLSAPPSATPSSEPQPESDQ
jgi:uroporphyrin-3 C-methyltransferase